MVRSTPRAGLRGFLLVAMAMLPRCVGILAHVYRGFLPIWGGSSQLPRSYSVRGSGGSFFTISFLVHPWEVKRAGKMK